MSVGDGFEATFSVQVDREAAWRRLAGTAPGAEGEQHLWLAGFDSSVTVLDTEPGRRLHATKDDEPCAGTDIVVTLEDEGSGTVIHVVQSRFGDWMAGLRDEMTIGWALIVADLQTYLATGVHARRFLGGWADLGAETAASDGGIRIGVVRPEGLAAEVGLADGDLLVLLDGAPVTSLHDLFTVLRARGDYPVTAGWIRDGALMTNVEA